MKGILGKKLGMTQVFTPEGNVIPVTVIEAGPCVVLQKKDLENDGYEAVQLGFADKKKADLTNQLKAMLRKLTLLLSATFAKFAELILASMRLAKQLLLTCSHKVNLLT